MSAVRLRPLLHQWSLEDRCRSRGVLPSSASPASSSLQLPAPRKGTARPCCRRRPRDQHHPHGRLCCGFDPVRISPVRANLAAPGAPAAEADKVGADINVLYRETFPLSRTEAVEGKVSVRLEQRQEDGGQRGRVFIGCSLEGKWALHWGVTYCDDVTSEWDQPPPEMRPPGSVPIKDYAIETPLKTSSDSEGKFLQELQIDLNSSTLIAAIHFVLKEEETGAWYQYRGRDFRIPLVDYVKEDGTSAGGQKGFNIWPGSNISITTLNDSSNATMVF